MHPTNEIEQTESSQIVMVTNLSLAVWLLGNKIKYETRYLDPATNAFVWIFKRSPTFTAFAEAWDARPEMRVILRSYAHMLEKQNCARAAALGLEAPLSKRRLSRAIARKTRRSSDAQTSTADKTRRELVSERRANASAASS